jgi:hypothetical protein
LDCTRFGFELLNQKMLEMKFFKMAHLTYFVIFHLKVIIFENVNLPHTYGHRLEKTSICNMITLSNFSHGSQTYSNRMESQYLIDTKNFIKIKNHFNPFLNIFTIFSTL